MKHTLLATLIAASTTLISPKAEARWALGMGAQYGGFLGVEYAWRYENHVASLGVGSLIFGVGTSLSLKWLLGERDRASLALALHPTFGWSGYDGDLEANDEPLASLSWNWHPHGYRSHGSEIGFGVLVFSDEEFDDNPVVPVVSVGFHF